MPDKEGRPLPFREINPVLNFLHRASIKAWNETSNEQMDIETAAKIYQIAHDLAVSQNIPYYEIVITEMDATSPGIRRVYFDTNKTNLQKLNFEEFTNITARYNLI
jgi:hypothetical protein